MVETLFVQPQLGNRWFMIVIMAYLFLLVVSFFILSAPPGRLGIYITLALLGVVAYLLGKRFFRVLALFLVVLALFLSVVEYKDGKKLHQKLNEVQSQGK